jgi:3-deoxy-D-manno-octulosonic-acid transferase
MLRFFYTALLTSLVPLMLGRLWWRGRREPGYRAHIRERFGEFSQAQLQGALWIHAVSVGEMRAAASLVAALREHYPRRPLLLTCMTATGRATASELYGTVATIAYLPYDFPWAIAALIKRCQPSILIIMETEIWPNLIAGCREAKVPVLLVNARLSEKSRASYAQLAPVRALIREALQQLRAIAAQSSDDAARLATLGAANVTVTGNMKFDLAPKPELVALGAQWRAALRSGTRKVLLAASTREGEETLIVDAYRQRFDEAARKKNLLVIVPRHPQRFDAVHAIVTEAKLNVQRRSIECSINAECEVWLGDSMDEMFAYIAMSDVVFVGGSLVPVGGQNLIEAAALGKPVIMGPSTFNFAEAAQHARAAEALIMVDDADAFAGAAWSLLHDDERYQRMSHNAAAFAAAHRGATDKTMTVVTQQLAGELE